MYCYQCGQYALDIEQPFWKYILQYFENVYQFDSKVWLTLYYLFTRLGFLTREFNAGKINSYVHPLRLFMFLSCLFFLFFFALIPSSLDSINWSVEGEVGESAEISAEDVVLQMDLSKDVIDFWYDLPIILLLLIPVFALLLKLFFRKEKMPYMKHYAFAQHLHSVLLLLVAVNLLWAYYVKTPYTKEVPLGLMSLFLLYMWIAIYQVYERTGWIKAFIKTGLLLLLSAKLDSSLPTC